MTEQRAKEMLQQIAYDGEYPMGSTDAFNMAIKALEEIEQYRALGMTSEQVKQMQIDYCAKSVILEEYKALGTVEELKGKNEKLQAYKNQISIYAEQHKVILASDVLDMLEKLE